MTDNLPDPQTLERIRELQKKRSGILSLPPEEALERILAEEGGPYEIDAVDAASAKIDRELGEALGIDEETEP